MQASSIDAVGVSFLSAPQLALSIREYASAAELLSVDCTCIFTPIGLFIAIEERAKPIKLHDCVYNSHILFDMHTHRN